MEFITESDLVWKYREGRREYISYVIDIIKKFWYKTTLELGPYQFPVVVGWDTMDLPNQTYPINYKITYEQDATKTPRNIEKEYDCFIGLQCFEHLDDKQIEAFKEVMRVAKNAIISLPYKWNCPGNCHHQIDEKIIGDRTWNIKPESIKRVWSRIVYHFTNLH